MKPLLRMCFLAAIAEFMAFVFFARSYVLLPNHDCAGFIIEAQKLLAGGHFQSEIMEVNPPLMVLLTIPGLLIAQLTGLDPWAGFVASVCLVMVTSLWMAAPYLRWVCNGKPLATVVLAFAYLATIALLPNYDFGQRENLVVVLFLPALLWFAAREAGRQAPCDLGCIVTLLLAAIGLLIKPFYLVVPAVLVILRAITHRSWRMLFGIETVVTLVVSLFYISLVGIFFREWISTALLAFQVYFAYDESWSSVLSAYIPSVVMLSVTIIFLVITPMAAERKIFLQQFAVAATVFLVTAISQHKGWSYHVLPTRQLDFLIAAVLGIEYFGLLKKARNISKTAFAGSLALLYVYGSFFQSMLSYYVDIRGRSKEFLVSAFPMTVRELAGDKPWLALSTSVIPAMPTASLVDDRWSSRSPSQWLIPGIVQLNRGSAEDRVRAQLLQRAATHFLIEDIERYHPVIVAVEVGHHQAITEPFEFLPFFAVDEDFRRTWSPYRLVGSTFGWQFYTRSVGSSR